VTSTNNPLTEDREIVTIARIAVAPAGCGVLEGRRNRLAAVENLALPLSLPD
jgi:hypothetical protein